MEVECGSITYGHSVQPSSELNKKAALKKVIYIAGELQPFSPGRPVASTTRRQH